MDIEEIEDALTVRDKDWALKVLEAGGVVAIAAKRDDTAWGTYKLVKDRLCYWNTSAVTGRWVRSGHGDARSLLSDLHEDATFSRDIDHE